MFRFGQKVQIFIFGLTVGLLIGSLIFILKLDDYFTKFSFSNNKSNSYVVEETTLPAPENKTQAPQKQAKKSTKTRVQTVTDTPATSASLNAVDNGGFTGEENINVLKEELIGIKNVVVKDFDNSRQYKSSSDSLLSAMSGINEARKNDFFMIEFWKTPLNSKGYKMTRNRLLVYGLQETPDIALIKIDDNYYLKSNSAIYKLSYSAEFKPMERTTEVAVLDKFN